MFEVKIFIIHKKNFCKIFLKIPIQITDINKAVEKIGKNCKNLNYLSLLGNPGCPDQLTKEKNLKYDDDDYERYFLYSIYVLPKTLKFLDSRTITDKEKLLAQSKGRFFKTVKFQEFLDDNHVKKGFFDETEFYVNYTPLPQSSTSQSHFKSNILNLNFHYYLIIILIN